MSIYAKYAGAKATPQSAPIPGREADMEQNDAGGYGFTLDPWHQLDRFLILGTEGGTYYVDERQHTSRAVQPLDVALAADPVRVVKRIVEVSKGGLGIKNDPAIFALAKALKCDDVEARRLAANSVPKVCRIGTHIFQLMSCLDALGGHGGRTWKRGVASWYTDLGPSSLAYQLIKYRQRDGWSHRDVLRQVHPKIGGDIGTLLRYATGRASEAPTNPAAAHLLEGFAAVQGAASPAAAAGLVRDYRLPREAVPPEFLRSPEVWEALLEDMPTTALVRNLATMTRVGLLSPLSDGTRKVIDQLGSAERLRKSRVHPMSIFVALCTYASGRSSGKVAYERARHARYSSPKAATVHTWTAVPKILDALNDAFYGSFGNVTPTGKAIMVAVDVSGSMSVPVSGGTGISCLGAAAAMALVTYRTEKAVQLCGWDTRYHELRITDHMRLDDVARQLQAGGGTDASIPYRWAIQVGLGVDAFVVLTDNETWAGRSHPKQALDDYRRRHGQARNINVAMSATRTSVGDPKDELTLQVVGFDPTVPQAISSFLTLE